MRVKPIPYLIVVGADLLAAYPTSAGKEAPARERSSSQGKKVIQIVTSLFFFNSLNSDLSSKD